MENNGVKKLSRAAIDERKAKLDDLKNNKRLEVAQEIKEARAFGDISENAEYDAAMDRQARIEYEIHMLEEELKNVEEIDENTIDFSTVSIGARVVMQELDSNEQMVWDVVSTSESEPFGKILKIECLDSDYNKSQGYKDGDIIEFKVPAKLSNESKIGSMILGKRKGDIVTIESPRNTKDYKIINIERIPEQPQGYIISEEQFF